MIRGSVAGCGPAAQRPDGAVVAQPGRLGLLHCHGCRYRQALFDREQCVLRYDNEGGKGDHSHRGTNEAAYRFTTIEQLLEEFDSDSRNYIDEHPHHR
jgi:Family of unknown function (DUF6516)